MVKLTTVIASVNNNPDYYMFIPKQILFWRHWGIEFLAVFVGENIPEILLPYKDNIILWNNNLELNTIYVAQNLRMYYTALIDLPDDNIVMITDMDMLPTNITYYTKDLETYDSNDFIYYRNIDGNQIYMCYNAAHPKVWGKLFNINNKNDIINKINDNYENNYDGIPGSNGWFIDQEIMYKTLINYEHLKILNRPLKRLEVWNYNQHTNTKNFIFNYDDVHFHRSYYKNESLILDAEKQLSSIKPPNYIQENKCVKIVVLIIASDFENHYIEMQAIWKKYMNIHPNIVCYFIKSDINIQDDIVIDENTIYVKNEESLIPGIYNKTIEAIKYCLKNIDYDYIYRTNLSSLIDMDQMYSFIITSSIKKNETNSHFSNGLVADKNNFDHDNRPKILSGRCNNKIEYGGIIGCHNNIEFASGSGFFISRDASLYLLENQPDIDEDLPDDVLIGYILSKKYNIHYINRNDITEENDNRLTYRNSIFHYRCKSNNSHSNTINIMNKIYNVIYRPL
jgi:hypothetical protein